MPVVITLEMVEATYSVAQQVYAGATTNSEAVESVVNNTGMKRGSAYGYISTIIKMLNGEPYGRTIKAEGVDYFLGSILRDYGIDKFSNALHSVRVHLETNRI